MISGILHALKTGCRWRDVPAAYGALTTIYNRYKRWFQRRIWQSLFEKMAALGPAPRELSIDSIPLNRVSPDTISTQSPHLLSRNCCLTDCIDAVGGATGRGSRKGLCMSATNAAAILPYTRHPRTSGSPSRKTTHRRGAT
ncbi:transposase [Novosphingobium beihaiensis]|uniref:transposase n=1 Tax=Novosphingobium beihaiensis TaxID=2930389 RepID=UPI003898E788